MTELLVRLSKALSGYASLVVIGVAIATFLLPDLFGWVKGDVQTLILGLIMLTMGLTLTTEDFKILLKRPWDIFIGACAQFGLMPLIALTLVTVFNLSTPLALGLLLVGCCPGGVSSNIMSFLCKGDVAFSVGMTCASTLLAPVLTPALMLWTAGQSVDVDAIGMFKNILIVTIVPIALGCLMNHYLSGRSSFRTLQGIMPGFSVVCLACIVGGVVSTVHDNLVAEGLMMFLWMFLIVFCHNSLGYLTGFLAGTLFRFPRAKKRTISIEVGMQNAGLATNLASNFFIATYPLAVVPCAISCAWHSISGTILAGIFCKWDSYQENRIKSKHAN